MTHDIKERGSPQIPCPPEKCRAKRHMEPWVYVTYESMLGMAIFGQQSRVKKGEPAGDRVFHGKVKTLANANNRSDDRETAAIKKLLAAGWIVPYENGRVVSAHSKQRRWRGGKWTTHEYLVLSHEEYAAQHGACPPYRYDPETDEQRAGDKQVRNTSGLELTTMVKKIRAALPRRLCTVEGCKALAKVGPFCEKHKDRQPPTRWKSVGRWKAPEGYFGT